MRLLPRLLCSAPLLCVAPLLFVAEPAHAGKLEAGWRGIPYGDPSVLNTPPTAECLSLPETGARWSCPETVGGEPVMVHYVVDENLYAGVLIECKSYTACRALFDTVTMAWKVPFRPEIEGDTSLLADGIFNMAGAKDGVVASWTYNRFTFSGQLVTADMKVGHEQKRRRLERAAAAAESI